METINLRRILPNNSLSMFIIMLEKKKKFLVFIRTVLKEDNSFKRKVFKNCLHCRDFTFRLLNILYNYGVYVFNIYMKKKIFHGYQ